MSSASLTLRSGLRDGESQRFLASCWVIVEAPRGTVFSSSAFSSAARSSRREKPSWEKNSMSSATTTACFRLRERREPGTQRQETSRSGPSPSQPPRRQRSMKAVVSGGSPARAATSGQVPICQPSQSAPAATAMPARRAHPRRFQPSRGAAYGGAITCRGA